MIRLSTKHPLEQIKVCTRERAEALRDWGVPSTNFSVALILMTLPNAPFGEWVTPIELWDCGFTVEHGGSRWDIPFCFIDM